MNEFRFEAEITCGEHVPELFVHERVYGAAHVIAEWPVPAAPVIRAGLLVLGDVDRRDAPAYVELFFHDVFLLLNLAAPGSFSGTVSVSGGELRVRELHFSARLFEYATGLRRLPLEQVAAWYDALQLGTQQVASTPVAAALFHLLQLARRDEDELEAVVRLASAHEALLGANDRFETMREAIAFGRVPVFHPLHDDGLDPRVHDAMSEWMEAADAAASAVIGELQRQIAGDVK
jgi:hypothetical protein